MTDEGAEAPFFVGTQAVAPPGRIVVVAIVDETRVPFPFGSEYVVTVNVSLPEGTTMVALQLKPPPAAAVQPAVAGVRFILTGAVAVFAVPLTWDSETTTDCIVADFGGTAIVNDALPVPAEAPFLAAGDKPPGTTPPPADRQAVDARTMQKSEAARRKLMQGRYQRLAQTDRS